MSLQCYFLSGSRLMRRPSLFICRQVGSFKQIIASIAYLLKFDSFDMAALAVR